VARKTEAGRALDELQQASDRLATWLDRNALAVLAGVLVVLAVVGLVIFIASRSNSAEERAAEALANTRSEYRQAMGATPSDTTIPEPANPETARKVRTEYVARFTELAAANPGTTAGELAWLEAGGLQEQLGDRDAALATWTAAEQKLDPSDPVRAFFLRRIAAVHEEQGAWAAAAQAYQAAAAIEGYPLRYPALADAARCYAEAGDAERAIAAYERIETEAPDFRAPAYVSSRIRELRAQRKLAGASPTPAQTGS
jgi:tetratricopeptide (TPR) repeat protein